MKHLDNFSLWESQLPSPPKILDLNTPSSTDVKRDLSDLFDFNGYGIGAIFYKVRDNEDFWVSYETARGEIKLWRKVEWPRESEPFIISKSPNVIHNASKLITASQRGLSQEASEWMEEELKDEPWEDAVKNLVRNGPATNKDLEIFGFDPHKLRGTIAAKKYNV